MRRTIAPRRADLRGITLIEVLIATVILSVVLLLTTSGIIQAIRTHDVQDQNTSSQAKMRRVVEVLTQELRGSVLGGISDFPVASSGTAVSFTLLTGTGGHIVTSHAGWGSEEETHFFEPDPSSLDELRFRPALIVNGTGDALIVSNVESVDASVPSVQHSGCTMAIDWTRDTQMFGARALGFQYDANQQTLFLTEVLNGTLDTIPFAFGITGFDIDYEYERTVDREVLEIDRRDEPVKVDGWPVAEFVDGTDTFELNRLKLTISTSGEGGRGAREYVGYVEMSGSGDFVGPTGEGTSFNDLVLCDTTGGGTPGAGGGGGSDDDDDGTTDPPPDDDDDDGGSEPDPKG